jgi:hypothetical protein
MARDIGSRTIDGASILRCMVVGLTPEQIESCRRALVPMEVVSVHDAKEAAARMSTVLPLVVIVDEAMSDADRASITEFTTACGAEIVKSSRTVSEKAFTSSVLEALRVAERRRLGGRY